MEGVQIDTAPIAKIAVDAAADKKASDILLLDIREVTTIADYFVVCTGQNSRQIQAIAESIDEVLKQKGWQLFQREGNPETGWILLDFGDIIIHIFSPNEREYYQLERLWGQAKTVVYLQ